MRQRLTQWFLAPLSSLLLLLLPLCLLTAAQSNRVHKPRSSAKPRVSSGPIEAPRTQDPSIPKNNPKVDIDQDELKLNADLVTVVVSVTSQGGEYASNLTAEDFEILEDQVPQSINGFSVESAMPLKMALLFDTSGSVAARREFEKRAAINFVRQTLRPQDRFSIFTINTETTLELPLTNRLETLVDTISQIKVERGATALYDAIYTSSEYLFPNEGRRIIVILSDGQDNVSTYNLKRAVAKVLETTTTVYAIHSYGRAVSANVRDPGAEQALLTLAEATGGDVYFAERVEDLEQSFRRFAAELHSQYILTFYSTNEKRDGSFRQISVRIKKPALQARARKGYYAPKE